MPSDGLAASFGRFWQRSYASDYVALALLITAYMLIQFFIEPFHRMFFLDNISIQFPHADVERVSVAWLFIYAVGVPLIAIVALTLLIQRSSHKAHVTILGLAISFILTSFVTDIIKNAVGRPRPDLIARCKPAKGTPAHELVTFHVCTETDHHILHDGWRSFPSGHSSSAFAGLGYLSMFIAGQLHVLRPRTDLAKALVAIAPLLGAALIAISRCEDYRHDVYDVTTGSLLGFLVALFSYRRYYPRLGGPNCDVPFPYPSETTEVRRGKGKNKARDEEDPANSDQFELDGDGSDEELKELERLPLTSLRPN